MRAPESYRGREQTWAKHLFLERYLERVARNILSFRDEFVYVDGFSGPWQSKDEELKDTSFAIALDQLRKVRDDYGKIGKSRRIRCLFNDGDAEAHERLQHYLAAIDDIETKAVCRNFEDLVPEIVAYVGDAFSLTFIDPTGWTDFALQKIQDLLRLPGEVIVNLMFDYVNRFVGDPRPEILSTFDPLFGGPDWYEEILSRIHEGQSREDAIVGIYCERLRRFGRRVFSSRLPTVSISISSTAPAIRRASSSSAWWRKKPSTIKSKYETSQRSFIGNIDPAKPNSLRNRAIG